MKCNQEKEVGETQWNLLSIMKSKYRTWKPTLVLLPGKSHGWRTLIDGSLWVRYKSDTTERLHFPFSLSRLGEGKGNPLHCSCLENPRDGGAWWAAVYGVAQSRTRLKRLSSCSSSASLSYNWKFVPFETPHHQTLATTVQ